MPDIDFILEGWSVGMDQGNAAFCGVTLIRGATKNILVDVAHVGRRSLLVENLAKAGLTPADIDTVVLTHSHWDHILNADVFKNAEFLLHPNEIEYAKAPHPQRLGDARLHMVHSGALQHSRGARRRSRGRGHQRHRHARSYPRLDFPGGGSTRRFDCCLR